jgi:hypothetical protein
MFKADYGFRKPIPSLKKTASVTEIEEYYFTREEARFADFKGNKY